MMTLTLSDILDDLRVAENGLHRFERHYWISSGHFHELYSRGLLDDGENAEDFAEWAGHYKLRQKRQAALEKLSSERRPASVSTLLTRTSRSQTGRFEPQRRQVREEKTKENFAPFAPLR